MDIAESLDRIHQSNGVLGYDFYAQLFKRHPDISSLFAGVDMQQQGALFTMQMSAIVAYHKYKSPAPGLYLQVLGTRHKMRGIAPETYPLFCDVLIEILADFFGHDWDDALAEQWRSAIQSAADKMLEGYEHDYHV